MSPRKRGHVSAVEKIHPFFHLQVELDIVLRLGRWPLLIVGKMSQEGNN
jgi:hypothetical protein